MITYRDSADNTEMEVSALDPKNGYVAQTNVMFCITPFGEATFHMTLSAAQVLHLRDQLTEFLNRNKVTKDTAFGSL